MVQLGSLEISRNFSTSWEWLDSLVNIRLYKSELCVRESSLTSLARRNGREDKLCLPLQTLRRWWWSRGWSWRKVRMDLTYYKGIKGGNFIGAYMCMGYLGTRFLSTFLSNITSLFLKEIAPLSCNFFRLSLNYLYIVFLSVNVNVSEKVSDFIC